MGIGKKLLSSGLGLTSEAIHAARSRSHSPGGPSSSSSTSTPARYADQATTSDSHLSAQQDGIIQRCDDKTEYGYDSDSSETNDLNALHQDEAAWELDDMVEELRPPPHEDTASTRTDPADPETRDSDADAQAKKEDEMVRRLLRMAGPPPRPTRRIPLPVIVPQRRPKQKSRGFVRAYAPVLADCGINQDVFLQFLEDFDQASKVCSVWARALSCPVLSCPVLYIIN